MTRRVIAPHVVSRSVLALAASVLVTTVGCDGTVARDAGLDAAADAGRDAGADAGPACTLACDAPATCCAEPDGAEICTTLRDDPRHCGTCVVDCIATDRGDGCSANQCTCGANLLGCAGSRNSFCCPPRDAAGLPYCTDLDTTPSDCGACNAGCDARVASHCDGGRCVWGDERAPCDGTPDSICCAESLVDVRCVDTTSDVFHCGGCNRRCQVGERCVEGTCTEGDVCAGGCGVMDICCNGGCCLRERCTGVACTTGVDGGRPDAGAIDAGTIDAGP